MGRITGGTGVFLPLSPEDIAAQRQNSSSDDKQQSADQSAGSADSAPPLLASTSRRARANTCYPQQRSGSGPASLGSHIRKNPQHSCAPTASRSFSGATPGTRTHMTQGRPFSSSSTSNLAGWPFGWAEGDSPDSTVSSWDEVDGAPAPRSCASFGGTNTSTVSHTPAICPAAGQVVPAAGPAWTTPRDGAGLACWQDSFIPLGGGTCLQSVISSSTAQCTFPFNIATAGAGGSTGLSSSEGYTIGAQLQLPAQLGVSGGSSCGGGGAAGGYGPAAGGQQQYTYCCNTHSGPLIFSSSGFTAVAATEGFSSSAVTAANSACSLGWNSFAGNSGSFSLPLHNCSQLQLQHQDHQLMAMRVMQPQCGVSSTYVSGDQLLFIGSAGGCSAPLVVALPPTLSAPTNIVVGGPPPALPPTSSNNNTATLFVGGGGGGGGGSSNNSSLSLGSAVGMAAAAPNSSGQHVGGGNDVAAVAAALAQDKLAQMQALEELQQQLRNEVAHLLPLI